MPLRLMMVLRSDVAMFTVTCPDAARVRLGSVQTIPLALREEVRFAAIEVALEWEGD